MYCLELRESFKGIKFEGNAKDADNIAQKLRKSRHLKHPQILTGTKSGDPFESRPKSHDKTKSEIQNSPKVQSKLHWTIKPCNIPSNNWYVCEKSVGKKKPIPETKRSRGSDPSVRVLENGKYYITFHEK